MNNISEYIKYLSKLSVTKADEIVNNDDMLTDNDKIKLLEYLVDRKIKETDYSKCKRISAIRYMTELEKEEKQNELQKRGCSTT